MMNDIRFVFISSVAVFAFHGLCEPISLSTANVAHAFVRSAIAADEDVSLRDIIEANGVPLLFNETPHSKPDNELSARYHYPCEVSESFRELFIIHKDIIPDEVTCMAEQYQVLRAMCHIIFADLRHFHFDLDVFLNSLFASRDCLEVDRQRRSLLRVGRPFLEDLATLLNEFRLSCDSYEWCSARFRAVFSWYEYYMKVLFLQSSTSARATHEVAEALHGDAVNHSDGPVYRLSPVLVYGSGHAGDVVVRLLKWYKTNRQQSLGHPGNNTSYVEIGVFRGDSAVKVWASDEASSMHLIDTWAGDAVPVFNRSADNNVFLEALGRFLEAPYTEIPRWGNRAQRLHFMNAAVNLGARILIHRTTGTDAAQLFEDESMDLVFIDADHEAHSVINDLFTWWPKVKLGGFLAGHDFHFSEPGVPYAVHAFFRFPAEVFLDDAYVWWVKKPCEAQLASAIAPAQSPQI